MSIVNFPTAKRNQHTPFHFHTPLLLLFQHSPFPTLTDATRVLHLGTQEREREREWASGRRLPVAWGMLSHLLQFLGHFSYSLSAINAAICKSNPSFPTSLLVLLLLFSPPPPAITPTSVINHAPCSKCSGGVSLAVSLSLSLSIPV